MKLSKAKMERLDARYTAYNPDQEVDGPDALVDLVCPIHGPYRCRSEHLTQRYTKRTVRPPQCKGCRAEKLSDNEFRRMVTTLWSIYLEGNPRYYDEEDYPIHPDFKFMNHWNKPVW